jgi:pyridoxal phosphate enzyme (YggS family)
METFIDRLRIVRERIAAAAQRAHRDPATIRLVGVTKAQPVEAIRAALDAGLREIGENRVQEAEAKMTALEAERHRLTWHLIGHLQTNKAKKAAMVFDMVHSVDSLRLAQAINRYAAEVRRDPGRRLPILLQVNVSGEATKSGFDLYGWETQPDVYERFLRRCRADTGAAAPGCARIDDDCALGARPRSGASRVPRDAAPA